jgi:hypothetical protein
MLAVLLFVASFSIFQTSSMFNNVISALLLLRFMSDTVCAFYILYFFATLNQIVRHGARFKRL